MRVDKWIWAVRMVKTRTLASQLCRKGKVLVNSEQVKPAKNIQIGDRVELSYKSFTKTYEVKGFLLKRSSATLAQECFVDCTDPEQNQHQRNLHKLAPKRAKGYGRPTKKERRQLEQFREWF